MISARHLDAAIASTADSREALKQAAQSDRFASHWREQEPREAASAVSEFQEGSTRPGSHRQLSSWARWLWKLVTR